MIMLHESRRCGDTVGQISEGQLRCCLRGRYAPSTQPQICIQHMCLLELTANSSLVPERRAMMLIMTLNTGPPANAYKN
jgi:hypothetical protein